MPPALRRILPGSNNDGFVQLPNQWRLRPAGTQLELGDFPVNIAVHPDGRYLAVLHCGYRDHEVVIVDTHGTRPRIVSPGRRSTRASTAWPSRPTARSCTPPAASTSVVHAFEFRNGYLIGHRTHPTSPTRRAVHRRRPGRHRRTARRSPSAAPGATPSRSFPLDDPDPKSKWSRSGRRVRSCRTEQTGPSFRENEGGNRRRPGDGDDCFPYTCLAEPSGKRLFVSLWNKAAVAVIDLATKKVVATWPTERHPTEMALSPDGKALYVACANSTKVSVLDPADRQARCRRSTARSTRRPRPATRRTACA